VVDVKSDTKCTTASPWAAAIALPHPERVKQWSERPIVVVVIKGKWKRKWKRGGKVGTTKPSGTWSRSVVGMVDVAQDEHPAPPFESSQGGRNVAALVVDLVCGVE
jgi:hypothetical protein